MDNDKLMAPNTVVLFPIDLYDDLRYIRNSKVYIVEDTLYFDRSSKKLGNFKFNILKPVYHRATMRSYYDKLRDKNIDCEYIGLKDDWIDIVKKYIKKHNSNLIFFDPVDRTLEKKIYDNFAEYTILDTPRFILTTGDMMEYDGKVKHSPFYRWMRDRHNILMKKSKPFGDKLTYDTKNRKPPYENMKYDLPIETNYSDDDYIDEAVGYIKKEIPEKNLIIWGNKRYIDITNLSDCNMELRFPINSNGAKARVRDFVDNYLDKFGDYQDVILDDINNSFIYHSGISPMLNIGLVTPEYIIDTVINSFNKMSNSKKNKNIHNVEGFIRQILGWREFCRYTYQHHRHNIGKNHFRAANKLNKEWYTASTGIIPIDVCIEKAFRFGYLHHIERLMVVANYMTLSMIDPKQMYRWFMEFSLDSYDWVMEFNIYSMGSYSDGGIFTSKPYVGSSRYILKMSNYKSGSVWSDGWDKLFWKFIKSHKRKIKKIPRLAMLLKYINR